MRKLLLTLAVLSVPARLAAGCGSDDEAASGAIRARARRRRACTARRPSSRRATRSRRSTRSSSKFPGGGQAGDKLKDADREGPARVGRADHLQGGHRALARRRGGVLRERHRRRAASSRRPRCWSRPTTRTRRADALEKSAEGKTHQARATRTSSTSPTTPSAGGRGVRRLPRARHRGRRQGRHRREQGRHEARPTTTPTRRPLERRRERPARASSTSTRRSCSRTRASGRARRCRSPSRSSSRSRSSRPSTPTTTASCSRRNVPPELAQVVRLLRPGQRPARRPARRLVARAGQTDLGKLIDFYVDAFAGACRRPRRDRGAAQGGHRARPPAGRARLDGRLRHLRARHERGEPRRRARDRDHATRRRRRASSRRSRGSRRRRVRATRIGPLSAPGGGKGFTLASADIPQADPRLPAGRPRGVRLRRRRGEGRGRPGREARRLARTSPPRSDSLGDYDVSFYVLDAADPRPGRLDRRGERRATGRSAKPYLEPLSALVARHLGRAATTSSPPSS